MVTAELNADRNDIVQSTDSRVDRPRPGAYCRDTFVAVGVRCFGPGISGTSKGEIVLYARDEDVAAVALDWLETCLDAGWSPIDPADVEALGHRIVKAAQRAQAEIEPAPVLDPRD